MQITQEIFNAAFNNGSVSYPGDCEKIVAVASSRLGLVMTPKQAEEVWGRWSGQACASWLSSFDDDEVVQAIESFVRARIESLLS